MMNSIHTYRKFPWGFRLVAGFLTMVFGLNTLTAGVGYAQSAVNLPAPGVMIRPTPAFNPLLIKGLTIYPDNPFQFDFIVDTGDDHLQGKALETESNRLIKYFLASLTVPEDEMWVNLSPYEKNRIIPAGFGQTEMGRDLLAQDYLLKQLTASLMYPEEELGKEFWTRVYQKAQAQYGTTEIPMNTFNKIWIVPEQAEVYVHGQSAFVMNSHLKVMLEEDYLALEANKSSTKHGLGTMTINDVKVVSGETSAVVREILIPEIEREVNEGKLFAHLRQIYHASILAAWFKQNLKKSVLGQMYIDQNKTKGVDVKNAQEQREQIYEQYVAAFKKGVFDLIKEEYDPTTQQVISHKYFSGGVVMGPGAAYEERASSGVGRAMSVTRRELKEVFSAIDGPFQERVVRITTNVLGRNLTNPLARWVANDGGGRVLSQATPTDSAMTGGVKDHTPSGWNLSREGYDQLIRSLFEHARKAAKIQEELNLSDALISSYLPDMDKPEPILNEYINFLSTKLFTLLSTTKILRENGVSPNPTQLEAVQASEKWTRERLEKLNLNYNDPPIIFIPKVKFNNALLLFGLSGNIPVFYIEGWPTIFASDEADGSQLENYLIHERMHANSRHLREKILDEGMTEYFAIKTRMYRDGYQEISLLDMVEYIESQNWTDVYAREVLSIIEIINHIDDERPMVAAYFFGDFLELNKVKVWPQIVTLAHQLAVDEKDNKGLLFYEGVKNILKQDDADGGDGAMGAENETYRKSEIDLKQALEFNPPRDIQGDGFSIDAQGFVEGRIYTPGFLKWEKSNAKERLTIAVDFDGVLAFYDPLQGKYIVREEKREELEQLRARGYRLILWSSSADEDGIRTVIAQSFSDIFDLLLTRKNFFVDMENEDWFNELKPVYEQMNTKQIDQIKSIYEYRESTKDPSVFGYVGIIEDDFTLKLDFGKHPLMQSFFVYMVGSIDQGVVKSGKDREGDRSWAEEVDKLFQERPAAQVSVDKGDKAMGAENDADTKGGIDLNPAMINLQTQGEAPAYNLPANLPPVPNFNLDGLYPVIIIITPVTNFYQLLGIKEDEIEEQRVSL